MNTSGEVAVPGVPDPKHPGDIIGALGTVSQGERGKTRSWRRKLRLLLVVMGPGLIVMGGGNDAGGVQVYLQMGQDYGMKLVWCVVLLFPILFICQEMVLRLGAVSGVEVLNGILLPSALVFLVLLANDKPVLGLWTNSTAHNWVCGLVVWAVTTFSLTPVVSAFFPDITLTQIASAFITCTVLGLTAAVVIWRLRPSRPSPAVLDPGGNRRPPGMDHAEWRAVLRERRMSWRTPEIDTLERPSFGSARWIGLLTLRAYIAFAIVIVVIKLVQTAS